MIGPPYLCVDATTEHLWSRTAGVVWKWRLIASRFANALDRLRDAEPVECAVRRQRDVGV
jgi:hypothetical protein